MSSKELELTVLSILNNEISTNELARISNVPKTTISRLRNNKIQLDNVSFINIKRLLDVYDLIK